MEQREISYIELKKTIVGFLEEKRAIVLATSSKNHVIARTVSYVSIDLQIFFWSYENHAKCEQIKENPRVALCRDNLQVMGIAKLQGSILDTENKDYLKLFKNQLPEVYDKYLNEPQMVLVSVKPTLFVLLVDIDGTLYRDHLNVTNENAYRLEIREDSMYELNK